MENVLAMLKEGGGGGIKRFEVVLTRDNTVLAMLKGLAEKVSTPLKGGMARLPCVKEGCKKFRT